jgi:hypothetical protein
MPKNVGKKFNAKSFSQEQLGLMLLQEAQGMDPDPVRVRAMIRAGALLDERDNMGNTPLILFTQHGEFGLAKSLVMAGADTTVRNRMTNTALIFSEAHGQSKLSELMQVKGARLRKYDRERIGILKTASMIEASHVAMFVQSGYENIAEREEEAAARTRKMKVVQNKGRRP